MKLPGGASDMGLIPGLGSGVQPTPVFLAGVPHRQRSLAGNSPRGHKDLDTAKRLRTQKAKREELEGIPAKREELEGTSI